MKKGALWKIKLEAEDLSRLMTKPTTWLCAQRRLSQITLGIRPVWSESSLCAQWVAKDPSFLHADSEDSDHTGRTPKLIRVFAGRTCHLVGFVMRRLILKEKEEDLRQAEAEPINKKNDCSIKGRPCEKAVLWLNDTLLMKCYLRRRKS